MTNRPSGDHVDQLMRAVSAEIAELSVAPAFADLQAPALTLEKKDGSMTTTKKFLLVAAALVVVVGLAAVIGGGGDDESPSETIAEPDPGPDELDPDPSPTTSEAPAEVPESTTTTVGVPESVRVDNEMHQSPDWATYVELRNDPRRATACALLEAEDMLQELVGVSGYGSISVEPGDPAAELPAAEGLVLLMNAQQDLVAGIGTPTPADYDAGLAAAQDLVELLLPGVVVDVTEPRRELDAWWWAKPHDPSCVLSSSGGMAEALGNFNADAPQFGGFGKPSMLRCALATALLTATDGVAAVESVGGNIDRIVTILEEVWPDRPIDAEVADVVARWRALEFDGVTLSEEQAAELDSIRVDFMAYRATAPAGGLCPLDPGFES